MAMTHAHPPPAPATNVHVTGMTPTSINVAWTAPISGSGKYKYTVFLKERAARTWTVGATAAVCAAKVRGLKPSTTYQIEIMSRDG